MSDTDKATTDSTKKNDSTKKDEEPALTKLIASAEVYIKPAIKYITIATPYFIQFVQYANQVYKTLSGDEVQLLVGLILCFFGGVYPTLFAAIEAAKHGGSNIVKSSLKDLAEEALIIIEESKKDDTKDDDGDGVADVDEVKPKELLQRKIQLVLKKMNPQKVDTALSNLYTVWMSVVATLTIQFARTIALSLTIADFMKGIVDQYMSKHILDMTPPEYHKWVPVVQGWVLKSAAMSFAWTCQIIISAFTSALSGGLLAARATMSILSQKGVKLGGLVPDNHLDTSADEYASYAFAAIGFYFQFKMGFSLPFPINILLFPLGWAEYYIRWSVTK